MGAAIQKPMQPVIMDRKGTVRFKQNAIVAHLLDNGPFDMNALTAIEFTDEDREQFAQLIGYSVGGYGELSYVSDESYDRAEQAANLLMQKWSTLADKLSEKPTPPDTSKIGGAA